MDTQLGLVLDMTRPLLPLGELCTEEEQAIASVLDWGRHRAHRIEEIAAATLVPERRVQDVIQHLLFDHHWPIGTGMSEPFGNYLIDTAAELEQTVELLRKRGISNLARAAALKKMSIEQYLAFVQCTLPVSES